MLIPSRESSQNAAPAKKAPASKTAKKAPLAAKKVGTPSSSRVALDNNNMLTTTAFLSLFPARREDCQGHCIQDCRQEGSCQEGRRDQEARCKGRCVEEGLCIPPLAPDTVSLSSSPPQPAAKTVKKVRSRVPLPQSTLANLPFSAACGEDCSHGSSQRLVFLPSSLTSSLSHFRRPPQPGFVPHSLAPHSSTNALSPCRRHLPPRSVAHPLQYLRTDSLAPQKAPAAKPAAKVRLPSFLVLHALTPSLVQKAPAKVRLPHPSSHFGTDSLPRRLSPPRRPSPRRLRRRPRCVRRLHFHAPTDDSSQATVAKKSVAAKKVRFLERSSCGRSDSFCRRP